MKDNTVPLKLIALLANGEFHSGEQLGETLGMSRAAINKHIQTLRDWGVDVFTVPGKGYSLPEPIQLSNYTGVGGLLPNTGYYIRLFIKLQAFFIFILYIFY